MKKLIIKKNLKKISVNIIIFSATLLTFTQAVNVDVPDSNRDQDVNIAWPTTIQGEEKHIFILIQKINDYLWFSIAAICFGLLIYAWVKLMSASWNEEEMKKSNKLLTWAIIWLIVAIVSYAVVRLIVNLV